MTPAETPQSRRTHGILVADDEEGVRDVMGEVLRRAGFAVWLARDGREALDVYRRFCAAIDVVLLDVCMPVLDGPETLAALQRMTPRIHCCFMSGYLGCHTGKKLRESGAAIVFTKPFPLPEAVQVLHGLAASRMRSPVPERPF